MKRKQRKRSSGAENWPLWKLMLLAVPVFGISAVMIGFYPDYSPAALSVGVGLATAAILVTVVSSSKKSWYLQIAYTAVWSGTFVAMGARSWATLLPYPWIWITLNLLLFLAVWCLPAIAPNFSSYLVREQTVPETRLGQGCLSLSLALMPAIGGLGSAIALYGPRYGLDNLVVLTVAILGSSGGLGLGQYFSHSLWRERPWSQETAHAG